MNAEALLRHYERIADAPDAVGRLRRFVLDLAVRGKLEAQDESDESAIALLNSIHRSRVVKRKFSEIDEDELEDPLPSVPPNWAWTTVDQLADDHENSITDGPFGSQLKTEHYIDTPGYRVIRLQNIGNGTFRSEHLSYIDAARFCKLEKHHLRGGDLVVAGLVDPAVRCCELPTDIGPAIVKADCYRFAVHPRIYSRFMLHFLNSHMAETFASVHHHGMTLTRIGLGNFRRIPVPLPPASEQHRIVAKVDELMALCDRLEAAREEREATRDRLAAASLARLNTPDPDPEAFKAHASFAISTALPALTTRPDQIKQLRQTIRNLGVRGMLVQQDPTDEPARQLLERIAREFDANKRLRNELILEGVSNIFCRLPDGWALSTLGKLSQKLHYGYTASADHSTNSVRLVRITDIQNNRVDWDSVPGCQIDDETVRSYALRAGDILIARTGGTIGKTFLVSNVPCIAVFASYLIRVQPAPAFWPQYLKLFCESDLYWEQLRKGARGGGQPNVNGQTLGRMTVLIPPAPEQYRIVAKVDELMALCDQLEASLVSGADTRRRLLDTLLHEALAPAKEIEAAA